MKKSSKIDEKSKEEKDVPEPGVNFTKFRKCLKRIRFWNKITDYSFLALVIALITGILTYNGNQEEKRENARVEERNLTQLLEDSRRGLLDIRNYDNASLRNHHLRTLLNISKQLYEQQIIDLRNYDLSNIKISEIDNFTNTDLRNTPLPFRMYDTDFTNSRFKNNFDTQTNLLERPLDIGYLDKISHRNLLVFDTSTMVNTDFSEYVYEEKKYIFFYNCDVNGLKLPKESIERKRFFFINCTNTECLPKDLENNTFQLEQFKDSIISDLEIILKRKDYKEFKRQVIAKNPKFANFKPNKYAILREHDPNRSNLNCEDRLKTSVLEWLFLVLTDNGKYEIYEDPRHLLTQWPRERLRLRVEIIKLERKAFINFLISEYTNDRFLNLY